MTANKAERQIGGREGRKEQEERWRQRTKQSERKAIFRTDV